jgi:transposase
MADLAKKQLRKKIRELQLALEGCLLPQHRFLLADMLEELDHIRSKIARVEQAIEQMHPYQKAVDAWMTVPGVKQRLAWNVVAEVGPTVDAFFSAVDLLSWAGICPGNK